MLLSASGFDSYTDRLFTNPCPVMPWFAPAHLPFAIVWKQSQLSENNLGLSLRAGLAPDDPKNVRWRQTRNMQNYAEGLCEGSVNVETCWNVSVLELLLELFLLYHIWIEMIWRQVWLFRLTFRTGLVTTPWVLTMLTTKRMHRT